MKRPPARLVANHRPVRVNIDFAPDMLKEIDRQAAGMHVTRQAWIKLRLADVLERQRWRDR